MRPLLILLLSAAPAWAQVPEAPEVEGATEVPSAVEAPPALEAPPAPGPLTLHIDGVGSTDGMMMIAVYDREEGFLVEGPHIVYKTTVKPVSPTTTIVVPGLDAGTYAVVAVHDENGNGVLDVRRVIPIPKEPIACSRDAKGTFGPPKYEDAKFEKGAGAHVERFGMGRL